jgi:hypothetical protein
VFARATVGQICAPGYAGSVRDVPEGLKQAVYAEYGIEVHAPGSYEVDHLVPLEVGGSNSIANLWPEASPGYHAKDEVENALHDAVCARSVALGAAQRAIARDWRHTYVGTSGGAERHGGPGGAPSAPASQTGGSAVFCSTHRCIASFDEGRGTIVQCADGEWSHSGGEPGVCSHHGGPKAGG